jgi:hypothetical protein
MLVLVSSYYARLRQKWPWQVRLCHVTTRYSCKYILHHVNTCDKLGQVRSG